MTATQSDQGAGDNGALAAFNSLAVTSSAGTKIRYLKLTSDGLLKVKGDFPGGDKEISLPSGLRVVLKETKGGRDYGTIDEGVLKGEDFDVTTGYLVDTYPRVSGLKVKARLRKSGVSLDPTEIAIEVTVIWVEDSKTKVIGPISAITSKSEAMPDGKHMIRIADFGHDKGKNYPPYGMVWFRVGVPIAGEYYIHGGTRTLGCLTIEPASWTEVYNVIHKARTGDDLNAGELDTSISDTDLTS